MLWTLNLPQGSTVEPTLSLGYSDIAKHVAYFLGWGRSVPSDAGQLASVNAVIDRGLRQMYYPPPLPGERRAHEWRFLQPAAILQTEASKADYEMPANFGSLIGRPTFAESEAYYPLEVVGEGQIRERRQYSYSSDRPLMCAIRPKAATNPAHGTRWELMLWPTPGAVYHITYQFRVLPNQISTTNEYPYGGMQMGELLLESCLAVAEEDMNDGSAVHRGRFMQLLSAAVTQERQAFAPDNLGYNCDNSHRYGSPLTRAEYRWNTGYSVTYTG